MKHLRNGALFFLASSLIASDARPCGSAPIREPAPPITHCIPEVPEIGFLVCMDIDGNVSDRYLEGDDIVLSVEDYTKLVERAGFGI